jgi:hypothetical protein
VIQGVVILVTCLVAALAVAARGSPIRFHFRHLVRPFRINDYLSALFDELAA